MIEVLERIAPELPPVDPARQTREYRELCIGIVEGRITDDERILDSLWPTGRSLEQLKADCETLKTRKEAIEGLAAIKPPDVSDQEKKLDAANGEIIRLVSERIRLLEELDRNIETARAGAKEITDRIAGIRQQHAQAVSALNSTVDATRSKRLQDAIDSRPAFVHRDYGASNELSMLKPEKLREQREKLKAMNGDKPHNQWRGNTWDEYLRISKTLGYVRQLEETVAQQEAECKEVKRMTDNDYEWADLRAEFLRWANQAVRNAGDYARDLDRFEAYLKVKSLRQVDHSYIVGYRNWRLSQVVGTVAGKEWEKADGRKVSPRTVNREVATLQNMLNKGVEWKRIGVNPIAGVKPLRSEDPRKQRRSLTVEEAESIFREAPAYLRPILRLFCSTGMRRSELTDLRFSDVDFDSRCITIRVSIAKSKKAREIPLDDYCLALLTELRDAAKGPDDKLSRDYVFVTDRGNPRRNNLLRAFYAVCQRAGIKGGQQGGSVDLHSLRVTFTTLSLDCGANPKAVQAILGHSTLALTMSVYAKVTERSKRDAIGALPFAKVTTPDHVITFPNANSLNTSSENSQNTRELQAISG